MRLVSYSLNRAISDFATNTRALEDLLGVVTREGGLSECIKKGSHKATLWLCASADHSAGVSAFDFRRCISERATSTRRLISSLALVPIASTFSSALREDSSGFSVAPSVWRLAISPRIAVTMNPALLSPSHFTDSIPCITSCGILAVSDCDLVFVGPVAIFNPPDIGVRQYTFKESYIKALTCKPPLNNVTYTLNDQGIEMAKPGSAGTLTGLLTTNANVTSEAAMFHRNTPHTGRAALTLKKITWRFLVLGEHAPVVVHITASSEQEARAAMPPCCIAIFAARIMRGGSANA